MYKVHVDSKDGEQRFFSNNCLIAMLLSCECIAQDRNPELASKRMEQMEQRGEIRTKVYHDGVLIYPESDVVGHLEKSEQVGPEYTLTIASREQPDGELPRHVVRYMLEGPTLGTVFDQFYREACQDMDVEMHKVGALIGSLELSGQLIHVVSHKARILDANEVLSLLKLEKETGGHA